MITLTKLNGKEFSLHAVYIETIEAFPDCTITLTNGNKFVVKESVEEVVKRVEAFYRRIGLFRGMGQGGEVHE
ncbi:MAG TPA: flagellar FlbD family protein [Bacillus sp. (in: firmicutes)]|uniref:flagellar FlbD family protein n=1 Tax=Bacillus litorisediminis TaxID=2922713 RepID=UPI001FAC676E|nr:flagellar FlbD family protein [Bacillus litorisediminis]HWO77962.1 flagellar FlbD family protein [Bacillus sp. (in: firmicutes)]